MVSNDDSAFEEKKKSTIDALKQEYESFFKPMKDQIYDPDFQFLDPLTTYTGRQAHKNNVEMLSGSSAIGRILFSDCSLVMHDASSDSGSNSLTTRWTLGFRFNLLPWKPMAQFTGVSEYTLDGNARLLRQQDFWDSVNLEAGGEYASKSKLGALLDLLQQFAPGEQSALAASERELPYQLLRRARKYEVRRYPQHIAVETEYDRRVDAFGTLGAYTGGANEASTQLVPYVPALMSIPRAGDSKGAKVMRWPMLVPAVERDAAPPPRPSGRLDGFASLAPHPTQVVAVLSFSDPTTEPTVRGYATYLRSLVEQDGLSVDEDFESGAFRLAQYDALNSFKTRRSEVWIPLRDHPW